MTDQNPAVAALAEATVSNVMNLAVYESRGSAIHRSNARAVLRVILDRPGILREYGIGRLPETKDVIGCLTSYGMAIGSAIDAASSLAADGYARPDPQPETTLPSVDRLMGLVRHYAFKGANGENTDELFLEIRQHITRLHEAATKAPRP